MNREQTLDVARKAVLTERAATHGPLDSSFGLIAGLWSPLVGHDITPAQVCLMLAALKIARAWDNPGHDDNWTDLAGYAACGAEVARRDGPDPATAPDWTTLLRETTPVIVRNGSRNYIVETPADLAALAEQVDALRTLNRELEGARQAEEPAPAQPAGGNEVVARSAVNWPAVGAVARGEMTPDEWLNGAAKAVSPEDARRFLASLEAQVASAGLQGAPVVAFNWQRPAPAQPAGGNEGGERAAQTAPAPVAVPTPAAQDRQGPPPSDKPSWSGRMPRVRNSEGYWSGGYTVHEDALAVRMAADGRSVAAIAAALERAPAAVNATLRARLAPRIAEARAARAAEIGTGAGAAVLPTPAPAPSTPGAVVAAAETAGTPPAEAPGGTDVVIAAKAARQIAERLRQSDLVTASLPEWVALIGAAREVQGWTLENDRQLLDLIGERWTPGDIANLTERSLDELKARKAQLTCAGKWPLGEVAAALAVEA